MLMALASRRHHPGPASNPPCRMRRGRPSCSRFSPNAVSIRDVHGGNRKPRLDSFQAGAVRKWALHKRLSAESVGPCLGDTNWSIDCFAAPFNASTAPNDSHGCRPMSTAFPISYQTSFQAQWAALRGLSTARPPPFSRMPPMRARNEALRSGS